MAATRTRGLGRGLDALLTSEQTTANEQLRQLPVEALKPGRYQPRTRMDAASLAELAESVKATGVMQPVLVRGVGGEQFEIISGERRWRAARMAGLSEIPALVREVPDSSALAMALIENIQREGLNPLEEAAGLQRLIDEFGMSHEQAAQAVGRSRSATSNLLRLMNLARPVQEMLASARIDMGHARALLALPKAKQLELAHAVEEKKLSVRSTESLVAKQLASHQIPAKTRRRDRDSERLAEELADKLGTRVEIRTGGKARGTITIHFSSPTHLDELLARLKLP